MFINPSKDWQKKKNEIKTMFFTLKYRRPVVWEVFPSISRISFPRFAPATPCLHPGVCGHGRQGLQFGILGLRKAPNQQGGQHEEAHGQEEEQMPKIRQVTWERPAPDWSNSACITAVFLSFRFLFHCHHGVCTRLPHFQTQIWTTFGWRISYIGMSSTAT